MEAHTIGKFITALRRASGMTQKELAERLHVSDKAVSRWEREESMPDLSLVPVLAEIFGVTCDELLRGQREKPQAAPPHLGDQQRQNLLDRALTRYKNGAFINLGICALGMIGAMICNLGFQRGYLGFFVACVFFAASLVSQGIFLNIAFSAVAREPREGAPNRYRLGIIRIGKTVCGVTVMLLGAALPLVIFPLGPYYGLSGGSWMGWGLVFGGILLVIWLVACHVLNGWILRKGICTLPPEQTASFWRGRKRKQRYAGILCGALAATAVLQLAANGIWSPWKLTKGTAFEDYESFVAYMETYKPYFDGEFTAVAEYYDEFGNPISKEEAFREELRIPDGTEEGKLVCSYIWQNFQVVGVEPANTEDGLPITVITQDQLQAGRNANRLINLAFIPLYLAEIAWVLIRSRKKKENDASPGSCQ